MEWLIGNAVHNVVAPLARRVGGQTSAFLVGVGMSSDNQAAVAAGIAWGIVTLAELAVSARGRAKLVNLARQSWGKN